MATLVVIPSTEAPRPPRPVRAHDLSMKAFEDYLMQVKAGKVGRLVPNEEGETPRGLSLRVNRAARRMNKTVNTWVVEGVVYFSHPLSMK